MASRGKLRPTPESTVGPFFPGAFVDRFSQDLTIVAPAVVHRPEGQPISVTFRFVDAAGKPVPSVIVEVWQANGYGRYLALGKNAGEEWREVCIVRSPVNLICIAKDGDAFVQAALLGLIHGTKKPLYLSRVVEGFEKQTAETKKAVR